MRSFEFALNKDNEKAYPEAQLPMYMTNDSAAADFYCAEEVKIPPFNADCRKPTLVHTGIKAQMEKDEVLLLFNRSGNPKQGLVLANGVGVIDADYYSNDSNDGEIMFVFFNITDSYITLKAGQRIGQGMFTSFKRPEQGLQVAENKRTGGLGSTCA